MQIGMSIKKRSGKETEGKKVTNREPNNGHWKIQLQVKEKELFF